MLAMTPAASRPDMVIASDYHAGVERSRGRELYELFAGRSREAMIQILASCFGRDSSSFSHDGDGCVGGPS